MSKDNGKIKVDKNSFDNMVAKQKPTKKAKDPYEISNNKLVAWFQRYWYYYKMPAAIAAFVLILATIFIVEIATKKDPDMCFTMITRESVQESDMLEVANRVTDYVADVNYDGTEMITPQALYLSEDPQDDYEMATYYQIMAILIDESYVAFIVDDGVYDYLMESESLEKLSYFGLETEEEYRLPINDTWLMEDTVLNDGETLYLVFKTCNADYLDDAMIQDMYEAYVDIAEDILAGKSRY